MTKITQDQCPPLVSDESSELAEHLGQTISAEWKRIDKQWKAWRALAIVGFCVILLMVIFLSNSFFELWEDTITVVEKHEEQDHSMYDQQGQIIKDQIKRINWLREVNSKLAVRVAVSDNAHENLRRSVNALLDDKESAPSLLEKHRSALIRAINQTNSARNRNQDLAEIHMLVSPDTNLISTP